MFNVYMYERFAHGNNMIHTRSKVCISKRIIQYGTERGQGELALFCSKHIGKVACINNIVKDRKCVIRIETN